jgi:dipeptidyl aminopeptidase/acylaminoacyl peptidase
MMRTVLLVIALAAGLYGQKQPFDVDALLKIARIGDPQIAPDGRRVAFTVQTIDIPENRKPSQIFTVPLSGGLPVQITKDGVLNQRARWSPDSKQIAFISGRSGASQVWLMNADGSNARQVTNLSTEADGVLFSPDGKNLVFTSSVYPECKDDACNKRKLEAEKNSKVQARVYTSLLYRHWNQWEGARRSHLMVVAVSGGIPKDLTPASGRDIPPFSLGGADGYAISPDGTEVCYAMVSDAEAATSTNSDLYVVPIAGGEAKKITANPAADESPQYSPDGKYIAYRAQMRPGYESDRFRLMLLERATGKVTSLTESVDRWVMSFAWAPDSAHLFFTTGDRGREPVQMVAVTGGGTRVIIPGDISAGDIEFTKDGNTMVYTAESGSSPMEIFRVSKSGGTPAALTHLNDALLANYQLTPLEDITVEGAEGTPVHSFLVKPAGFQEGKKYPVLFLIHGGPEGNWGESWTYRWNAQVLAGAGYVVVEPNPRGSTGYGQKFIDEINGDWGGRAFDDIMAVADHAAKLPYADPERMAAAGGSYGGYMVDWILGHSQRFKALVSHAGVYDLRSEFGATEELWFPLWEFHGAPWDDPEMYARWSPSYFVKDFKTPTLVIHGEQDYRVPYGQGLQLFTALQLQKVPSKLLIFPDEGHWIQKPQNAVLWYKTFVDWIDQWTKK